MEKLVGSLLARLPERLGHSSQNTTEKKNENDALQQKLAKQNIQ